MPLYQTKDDKNLKKSKEIEEGLEEGNTKALECICLEMVGIVTETKHAPWKINFWTFPNARIPNPPFGFKKVKKMILNPVIWNPRNDFKLITLFRTRKIWNENI